MLANLTSFDSQADIAATGLLTLSESKSVIVALVRPSKKTTSSDKSPVSKRTSRRTKSSKTSVVDLTGNGKDCLPYWNESVAEKSAKLWSPTVTDFAGLVLNSFNGYAHKTVANSWFNTQLLERPNKKWSKICSPLFTSSHADSTANVVRTRKIKLRPNNGQRKTLLLWCDTARWVYNQCVEKKVTNRYSSQKEILASLPERLSSPYKIKQMAIEDQVIARRNGFKFAKAKGRSFSLSFRRRKDRRDSVYIPKESVNSDGIFPRLLGKMKASESLARPEMDCRLLHENGKFYLLVPYYKPRSETQAIGEVAVDPGVRTFITLFSPDVVGKIGHQAINRIYRLCRGLDDLISRRKFRAVRRLRIRIRGLINELHHKASLWLVKNFETIIIPKFDAREMTVRNKRKIRSKTARQMLTLAHGRFRQILIGKCEEWNRSLIHISEAYTSKTCSVCGKIHVIGGRKVMNCCQQSDRDINGARGIFLRALDDTPARNGVLKEMIPACLDLST